jgi:hypothetical protein
MCANIAQPLKPFNSPSVAFVTSLNDFSGSRDPLAGFSEQKPPTDPPKSDNVISTILLKFSNIQQLFGWRGFSVGNNSQKTSHGFKPAFFGRKEIFSMALSPLGPQGYPAPGPYGQPFAPQAPQNFPPQGGFAPQGFYPPIQQDTQAFAPPPPYAQQQPQFSFAPPQQPGGFPPQAGFAPQQPQAPGGFPGAGPAYPQAPGGQFSFMA